MGSKTPAPVPADLAVKTASELIKGFMDCYRDVKIAKEMEATERYKARKQAEVYIKQIESNTQKYMAQLDAAHTERMVLLNNLTMLMSKPDIGEWEYRMCLSLMDLLNGKGMRLPNYSEKTMLLESEG